MTDTEPNLVSTNNGRRQNVVCGHHVTTAINKTAVLRLQKQTEHCTFSLECGRQWLPAAEERCEEKQRMVNGYKSVLDRKNNFQCYLDFLHLFSIGETYVYITTYVKVRE